MLWLWVALAGADPEIEVARLTAQAWAAGLDATVQDAAGRRPLRPGELEVAPGAVRIVVASALGRVERVLDVGPGAVVAVDVDALAPASLVASGLPVGTRVEVAQGAGAARVEVGPPAALDPELGLEVGEARLTSLLGGGWTLRLDDPVLGHAERSVQVEPGQLTTLTGLVDDLPRTAALRTAWADYLDQLRSPVALPRAARTSAQVGAVGAATAGLGGLGIVWTASRLDRSRASIAALEAAGDVEGAAIERARADRLRGREWVFAGVASAGLIAAVVGGVTSAVVRRRHRRAHALPPWDPAAALGAP